MNQFFIFNFLYQFFICQLNIIKEIRKSTKRASERYQNISKEDKGKKWQNGH